MEISADVILRFANFLWSQRDALARNPADIVSDLRLIRFGDDGLLSVLKAIARGKEVPPALFVSKLQDFNDSQWAVESALVRLTNDCPSISFKLRRELEEVAFRKRGVRADLQQTLNASPESFGDLSRSEARTFVEAANQLNSAIEEAEDVILHGRGHA